jgi:hypothetical protein
VEEVKVVDEGIKDSLGEVGAALFGYYSTHASKSVAAPANWTMSYGGCWWNGGKGYFFAFR